MDGRDSVLLVCNVCAQDPTSYTRYFRIKIHHCAAHTTYYNVTCFKQKQLTYLASRGQSSSTSDN